MKKSSVLIQRALIFTAIVALVAVAVGLPAYLLASRSFAIGTAREDVLAQARQLASAADESDERFRGGVNLFALSGGKVWTVSPSGTYTVSGEEIALPETVALLTADALIGYEYLGETSVLGQTCAFAMTPVIDSNGMIQSALVAALPIGAGEHPLAAAMIGLLSGLAAGAVTGWLLIGKMLIPVVRPIGKLRDVAVAISDGSLDVRASERYPGEIGELGKALNNVSKQLSRSMYSLILERNRLKHMLDGLSEGIIAIDEAGRVSHANPALERMFIRQKTVHLPDPRMKLIPDETVWEDFDAVLRTGEPITRNMDVRDMTIRLTISPTTDELGAIVGAVGLFSDITQMERLERTRREYVSNVSHELRTPLTAMRALVEPLKEGMVTSEADRQRYYDIIMREVMRLSRLINDQLELSRLQSGTIAIQKSKMTIDDLVYDVCDRYSTVAEEQGLELKVLTDFSECPTVYANADRVEQMLIILLDNAIKYTEEGSISVSGSWDDEKVTLCVKDTGVGIDDEDLPYVFDRFYKVDKAHSGKGSGLGLSIACELLKRMDEEIWVTSTKGQGSEFCFTIHRPTAED